MDPESFVVGVENGEAWTAAVAACQDAAAREPISDGLARSLLRSRSILAA